MRRWVAVPFYGALLAPVWLLMTDVGVVILAAFGVGAALGWLARRRGR